MLKAKYCVCYYIFNVLQVPGNKSRDGFTYHVSEVGGEGQPNILSIIEQNHHFSKFECAIRFYYHCMLIHILNYDTELPNVFEILF